LHPICAVPTNWILDKFGMRIGCTIGSALVILGVWLRVFIYVNNSAFVLIGSILTAIGNVFILNSPSILANNWFKPASMPGVISLAVLANMVSITLGNSLPGLIISSKPTTK
jgi:MFS family permease